MIVHPGPHAIKPHAAPGALVVHIYDTRDGGLVTYGPVDLDADIDAICADQVQELARLVPRGVPVCLVFYDGDTGRRLVPRWAGAGASQWRPQVRPWFRKTR